MTLLDKYGSKHTGSQTNVQAKIRGTYGQMRTDRVYILEGTNGVYILANKYLYRNNKYYDNLLHDYRTKSLVLKPCRTWC